MDFWKVGTDDIGSLLFACIFKCKLDVVGPESNMTCHRAGGTSLSRGQGCCPPSRAQSWIGTQGHMGLCGQPNWQRRHYKVRWDEKREWTGSVIIPPPWPLEPLLLGAQKSFVLVFWFPSVWFFQSLRIENTLAFQNKRIPLVGFSSPLTFRAAHSGSEPPQASGFREKWTPQNRPDRNFLPTNLASGSLLTPEAAQ